jgi:hypothetical protein
MVRLGILLDDETAPDSVIRLAVVAQRAGLDGLWLTSEGSLTPKEPSELLALLVAAAERTSTIVLGAHLSRLPDGNTVPETLAMRLEAVLPASPTSKNGWKGRITVRIEDATQGPFDADGVVVPIWAFGPTLRWPPVPVAIELAASIGRTTAEATARLATDRRLRDRRSGAGCRTRPTCTT